MIGSLIIFILILGVIVLVHEFGHYIWSKKFGVYVHEFAIGMGPKLWGKRKGETEYTIRAIPIGGFCSLAGEDGSETDEKGKEIPKNRKLFAKPIWQRFLILFFGAGNNFILAYILLFLVGLIGGSPVMEPVVSGVVENYPMEIAGVSQDDLILEVNGHKTKTIDDVQLYLTLAKEGKEVKFKVKKYNGDVKEYSVLPKLEKQEDGSEVYRLGVEFNSGYRSGFFAAIRYSYEKAGAIFRQMVIVLSSLFTGKLGVNNLSGPVGIYGVVDEAKSYGILTLLNLTALLSINVGFLNLIPFPAFDGGRIFLLLIEKLRGKPLPAEKENLINMVGFILIMMLAVYVMGHDIFNLLK